MIPKNISLSDMKLECEENKKRNLQILFKTFADDLMTAKLRVNDLEV